MGGGANVRWLCDAILLACYMGLIGAQQAFQVCPAVGGVTGWPWLAAVTVGAQPPCAVTATPKYVAAPQGRREVLLYIGACASSVALSAPETGNLVHV